jgi:Tol biopolymer transport system component
MSPDAGSEAQSSAGALDCGLMLGAGIQVGPYEILGSLGAGGMGEVYRARDTRLGRDVAVKVLPAAFSGDPDRLRRFEQEARAAGMLNHPNLLAIFDVGTTHEGAPYVVSELLEGETLRARLDGGPLPARKAIEYALQIAQGLAAAHDKGIVHRDLKPENLFVTRDGRVKILDFGLAKLLGEGEAAVPVGSAATLAGHTQPGRLLGTAGYMSPEQVRGESTDPRSDLFTFGAILYEMLSGRRAFRGDSAVETMSSILKEEPPDLAETNRTLPSALERIVRHALEKNPEERFQSARDLAFHLLALSDPSGPVSASANFGTARRSRRVPFAIAAGALAAIVVASAFLAGRQTGRPTPPTFKRLTFRRGTVSMARFAPDGQAILYGAAWDGKQLEIFSTLPQSPESRSMALGDADLMGVSASGDLALLLESHPHRPFTRIGTLARAPLAGGAPREIAENVQWADWAPDGTLAIVRDSKGMNALEYPMGHALYETAGWVSHPRVSPTGDRVAFLDHPARGDDAGEVAVVDRTGKKCVLSSGWISIEGLAWSPSGDEVWFTATRAGLSRAVHAVTPSGKERLLTRVTGTLTLMDVSRDGRVLLSQEDARMSIQFCAAGETAERDLSWLDWSLARDLSADGTQLLFDETGEGAGSDYCVYLRPTDGSPAVRLGEGLAMSLSNDGRWALGLSRHDPSNLLLLPTRAGERKVLKSGVASVGWATWFPDGKHVLFWGREAGHGGRLYVEDVDTQVSRPITGEGVNAPAAISPDGKLVAARDMESRLALYSVEGGAPKYIPGVASADIPKKWSADGRWLYLFGRGGWPAKVTRLEVATGRIECWKEIAPADRAGLASMSPICLTPDGRSYAYSYARLLSDLYLAEGVK